MTSMLLSWNSMPQKASITRHIRMRTLSLCCGLDQSSFKRVVSRSNFCLVTIACFGWFVFPYTHKAFLWIKSFWLLLIRKLSTCKDSAGLILKNWHFLMTYKQIILAFHFRWHWSRFILKLIRHVHFLRDIDTSWIIIRIISLIFRINCILSSSFIY